MNATELLAVLQAASHALRSYQHGNAAPELARNIADAVDATARELSLAGLARDRFDYTRIDPLIRESLDAYAKTGRPVGSFLTALLSNDLFQACSRADNENVWTVPIITAYVYNHLPGECWGSAAKVKAWIQKRGLVGGGYPEDAPLPDAPEAS